MIMIPTSRVDDFKIHSSEPKKDNKIEIVEKTSFKSEYDRQVDSVKDHNGKKVDSQSQENNQDVKSSNSNVEESKVELQEKVNENVKSDNGISNVDSEKNIKNLDKLLSNDNKALEGKVSESFIKKLINKDSKSEKNIKDLKTVNLKGQKTDITNETKLLKKSDSDKDKLTKSTDKDNLKQSLAGSQNIQSQIDNIITNKLKEGPEGNSQDIELVSNENEKTLSNNDNQKASFSLINKDKNIINTKKDSKTDKNSKSESKLKVNDVRSHNKNVVSDLKETKVKSEEIVKNEILESTDPDTVEGGLDNTITLGTTEVTAEGDGGKSQAPVMKEAVTLLKQQLKDFGNNEIVKQSRFILKDNNVGEIKLILKPESLGQVKINLNLNENSLAGQIVVENNSVKEVFQQNMNQLSKALIEQGYDSAKLDISLNDKETNDDKGQNKQSKQYFSDRLKRIDESGQVVRYGAPTAGIDLTA